MSTDTPLIESILLAASLPNCRTAGQQWSVVFTFQ